MKTTYNQLLANIGKELDISPSNFKKAVQRYTSVGKWLEDGSVADSTVKSIVYPQGSFRLGTVVRPLKNGKESEFDIDLVCQLTHEKIISQPEEIKMFVGVRLKNHNTYKKMLEEEGRRCWTLKYAEDDGFGFHLDILPSISEDPARISEIINSGVPNELAIKAIAITNKTHNSTYSWLQSNPNGYADWFDAIKKPAHDRVAFTQKQHLVDRFADIYEKVEDVPDPLVKTPLQIAIQILKRHRDVRFAEHDLEDDKPISMIITTLSALLYEQEEDVFSTLENICNKLDLYSALLQPGTKLHASIADLKLLTRESNGKWYIPNPVNPNENFADRWHENNNRKANAFFEWIRWVRQDLIVVFKHPNISIIGNKLESIFGQQLVHSAARGLYTIGAPSLTIISGSNTDKTDINITPTKPWRQEF